jgi:hypothetical protein
MPINPENGFFKRKKLGEKIRVMFHLKLTAKGIKFQNGTPKKTLVYKKEGWEPIHKKYKANISTKTYH